MLTLRLRLRCVFLLLLQHLHQNLGVHVRRVLLFLGDLLDRTFSRQVNLALHERFLFLASLHFFVFLYEAGYVVLDCELARDEVAGRESPFSFLLQNFGFRPRNRNQLLPLLDAAAIIHQLLHRRRWLALQLEAAIHVFHFLLLGKVIRDGLPRLDALGLCKSLACLLRVLDLTERSRIACSVQFSL